MTPAAAELSPNSPTPSPDAPLSRRQLSERWGFECGLVHVLATSPGAVRVRFVDLMLAPCWVPRSQIHYESEVPAASEGILVVTRWWANTVKIYEGDWLIAKIRRFEKPPQPLQQSLPI